MGGRGGSVSLDSRARWIMTDDPVGRENTSHPRERPVRLRIEQPEGDASFHAIVFPRRIFFLRTLDNDWCKKSSINVCQDSINMDRIKKRILIRCTNEQIVPVLRLIVRSTGYTGRSPTGCTILLRYERNDIRTWYSNVRSSVYVSGRLIEISRCTV